jgi:hypothetical protein
MLCSSTWVAIYLIQKAAENVFCAVYVVIPVGMLQCETLVCSGTWEVSSMSRQTVPYNQELIYIKKPGIPFEPHILGARTQLKARSSVSRFQSKGTAK